MMEGGNDGVAMREGGNDGVAMSKYACTNIWLLNSQHVNTIQRSVRH